MDAGINEPKVIESDTIVRALEFEVAVKWVLVDKSVHEELDFIEDTNVILLVLNLEVAIR